MRSSILVALAVLGGAILGACLAPVLAPPILGLFGFGVAGPVAGTSLGNPSFLCH